MTPTNYSGLAVGFIGAFLSILLMLFAIWLSVGDIGETLERQPAPATTSTSVGGTGLPGRVGSSGGEIR